MVYDLTREEEILRTKEIIHDRLGSTLITTRRYLENGTLSENNSKLLEMWKNNISVLNTAENDCKDENFVKDIENAAKRTFFRKKKGGTNRRKHENIDFRNFCS